jgi:hypothetical protein
MSARNISDDADSNDGRVVVWALQDVKESLDALVEQQRIANLIAMRASGDSDLSAQGAFGLFDGARSSLRPEIRKELGL